MNDKLNNEAYDLPASDLPASDVDWLGWQYLTGELPADEVVRFEARLASDQAAREALARVVALSQAVAVVESTTHDVASPAPSRRRDAAWMTPSAWLAAAALACLAGVLFWNPQTPSPRLAPVGQPLTVNDAAPLDSGELAVLWVGTAEFLASTELIGDNAFYSALFDDELLELPGEPITGSETDLDRLQAPSWMMAALADLSAVEGQE